MYIYIHSITIPKNADMYIKACMFLQVRKKMKVIETGYLSSGGHIFANLLCRFAMKLELCNFSAALMAASART